MDENKVVSDDDWIPIKWHAVTEEERKEEGYPDEWVVMLDCPMPNDEEEILITVEHRGIRSVEKDICYIDEGFSLDSGYDWITDVIAWMPIVKPYTGTRFGGEYK